MMRPAVMAVMAVVVALGCAAQTSRPTDADVADAPPDAPRPAIDPAPYETPCPPSCPSPYACVTPTAGHDPGTDVCLVPCDSDAACPVGFFCNGVEQTADIGALHHCVADV